VFEQCIATLEDCRRKLEEFRLGGWLRSEASMLPQWRRKPRSLHNAHSMRTTYLRTQFNARDVAFLRHVVAAPDPITALNDYRARHERTLRAKRSPVEADPDVMDATWRTRPERVLTAEEIIREQLGHNPRLMAKELARMRRR
jgi:hypothetical protein